MEVGSVLLLDSKVIFAPCVYNLYVLYHHHIVIIIIETTAGSHAGQYAAVTTVKADVLNPVYVCLLSSPFNWDNFL